MSIVDPANQHQILAAIPAAVKCANWAGSDVEISGVEKSARVVDIGGGISIAYITPKSEECCGNKYGVVIWHNGCGVLSVRWQSKRLEKYKLIFFSGGPWIDYLIDAAKKQVKKSAPLPLERKQSTPASSTKVISTEMTPAEFSAGLKALGWTANDFQRMADVEVATVRYWLAGREPIPGWTRKFIGMALITKGLGAAD